MKTIATFISDHGRIDLNQEEGNNPTFIVVARGFIGPKILRKYIAHLKRLDQTNKKKFNHVVDTTHVKFASPLNPFYLREISKLEHLNLYIVIVPSAVTRKLVNLTKWINRPDYVIKSHSQLENIIRRHS